MIPTFQLMGGGGLPTFQVMGEVPTFQVMGGYLPRIGIPTLAWGVPTVARVGTLPLAMVGTPRRQNSTASTCYFLV